MTTHELKVWPDFFTALVDGSKPYEVRKNDRKFAVGDELILREWIPKTPQTGVYSGRELRKIVTCVTHGMGNVGVIGPCRGISLGFVVLGLTDSQPQEIAHDDMARHAHGAQSRDDCGAQSQLPLV